jgi:hypothetical protein
MRIRIQNTDFSGAAVWVELVAVFVDEWAFYGCSATRRAILVLLSLFGYV